MFDNGAKASRYKIAVICSALVAANLSSWAWALIAFHDRAALLGSAVLAYSFGLRHAFDVDHIAAIDNIVRKLVQDGKKPFTVGLFFSLGHSTVVVLASLAIVAATAVLERRLEQGREIGGVVGTAVSATFLLAIGLANLAVLGSIWATYKRVRRGENLRDSEMEALLSNRGIVARVLRPVLRLVSRSWHIYAVGFLFGLGFDTATEIGLLGISSKQAAAGLPIWTILVFPALFTAGMTLMDTLDSVLMTGAYGWASVDPLRKLRYNLAITALSVTVALVIGAVESLGLIGDRFGLAGSFWSVVASLNDSLAGVGFIVVAVFLVGWVVATAINESRRLDTRETA